MADARGDEITIEPWDYRYYAEKVRRARYDLDSDEVKQYLQLDKLREAMFYVAGNCSVRLQASAGRLGAGVPRGRPGLGSHATSDTAR